MRKVFKINFQLNKVFMSNLYINGFPKIIQTKPRLNLTGLYINFTT